MSSSRKQSVERATGRTYRRTIAKHGRLALLIGGCVSAGAVLGWASLSGAIGATGTATPVAPPGPLPAAQAAAASGQPMVKPPPVSAGLALPTTQSPWFQYATQVVPDNAISFANAEDGWIVNGLGTNQSLDDNLTAGFSGQIWPGTGVAITTDGGTSWDTTLNAPTGIWGIDALSAAQVWAVGVTVLYSSQDGGASWTRLGEPSGTVLVNVAFTSARDGVGITTHGTLVTTTDGGRTWVSPGVQGLSNLADACASGTSVLVDDQAGTIWENSDLVASPDWSEAYASPSTSTSTESVLSCGAGSGAAAWEETAPNQIGSTVRMTVAQSPQGASGVWTQSASNAAGSSMAVVAGTKAPPSATDWVPITGASAPLMFGNATTPRTPAAALYQSTNGSTYTPVSTPNLFGAGASGTAASTPAAGSPGDLVVAHGVDFDSPTDGWLYADVLVGVGTSSLSDRTVLYHSADGGTVWSAVYQSVGQPVSPSNA